ncbi:MAG: tRNA N6-adenosine threonylcarbamoyltransferase [Chthoniobacter sp.]|nr:tRNA N6-adenosine threonylcarbamoyltransferase [Chthoniobacter sp.]
MSAAAPVVLAIETSCDETAVAILRGRGELLASEVASQIALHRPHGGVVPEVASRHHLTQLRPVIDFAQSAAGLEIREITAVAATLGPGLATSLMIGASAAKGLAIGLRRPFIGINHLEGHLLSPFFGREIEPCVALIVSGGHTLLIEIEAFGKYRMLGQTRDDAAGEAFDKVGKLLGLPYPGGPEVDRCAREGDPRRFDFPRSMMQTDDFDFSFSGLKTSVRYLLPKLASGCLNDVCASFQEAVVDVLVGKAIAAAEACGKRLVALSGGVSCNSRLREKLRLACHARNLRLAISEPQLCTDNAAMIAFVAALKLECDDLSPLGGDIDPNLRLVA